MQHEYDTILSIPFGPSEVRTTSPMAMITPCQNTYKYTIRSCTFRSRHIGEADLHGFTLVALIKNWIFRLGTLAHLVIE